MNKVILMFFLFISMSFAQSKFVLLEKALLNKDSSEFYVSQFKKQIKNNSDLAHYFTFKTEYWCQNQKLDCVLVYSSLALEKIKKLPLSENINLTFKIYRDVSQSYRRKGEYEKAIEIVLKGLKLAEKHKNPEWIVFYNCLLSLNYHDFESYEKGVFYGKRALSLAKKYNRNSFSQVWKSINATAISYDDWNKPDSALFYHNMAVKLAKNEFEPELVTTFNNIGNTLLKQKKFNEARISILKANKFCDLKYRNKQKGYFYFYDKSTQLNNLATIAYELKEYSLAEKLFDSSYYYSKKTKSAEKLRDYYHHRTKFNKLIGNFKQAFFYQEKYLFLRDSVFQSERDETFAELEAKYQTEKKEKELIFSKSQIIQKDLETKQKNNQLIIASILSLGFLVIGFLFYRQQKLKNEQQKQEFKLNSAISKIETQNKLQEQRLSISRDLHDNIGAQLTFIISSVDSVKYGFEINNEKLDNKLTNISSFAQETIVELRDTIWAMNSNEISFEDLEGRIHNFIEKAKEVKQEITFSFEIDENLLTKKLTSVEGMNVYRTIQEAINNSLKYANAKNIKIEAIKKENQTRILISDDGLGFNEAQIIYGNGLNNMKKRIKEIGGKLHISSSEKGTIIEVLI